ncbi:MAG: sensor histidine kinase [Actinomycetota bacterium]
MDPSTLESPSTSGTEADASVVHAARAAVDRFRRFGVSLAFDAVGAVAEAEGSRTVTWWHSPDAPALPIRIDDVVEGRLEGWLVCVSESGTAFARPTTSSPVDAPAILSEHAEALIAATGDDPLEAILSTEHADEPEARESATLERALDALRTSLGETGTTQPDALEALRAAIGAADLFVLRERGERIDVSTPAGERTREISSEVCASIRSIDTAAPVDDGTLGRLGVVLGISGGNLAGAFGHRDGRLEGIVAAWEDVLPPAHHTMELLLSIAGSAADAIAERHRAADLLMRRERTHLAYELHDGVTQAVTQAVLELELLGRQIAEDPASAAIAITETKEEIRRALGALRGTLFELSTEPAADEIAGDPFAEYVREVAARWNLAPTVDVEGDLDALPGPLLTTAWSVVREALINAAKHSGSSEAAVRATASPSELSIEIEDHGTGFDPEVGATDARHLGLRMMQTRVSELGGSIDIASSPQSGTRVVAHLPVRNRGDAS